MQILKSSDFEKTGFVNGFSMRGDGVSLFPADSLNLDYKIDEKSHVDENRRRLLAAMGCEGWPILTAKQVHSNGIFVYSGEVSNLEEGVEADALVTRETGILLAVKTADCLPILVADPVRKAAAAVHAGWRGTVADVAGQTIRTLAREFGSDPSNCLAVLGPAACGGCYEVRFDVIQKFEEAFGPGRFMRWIQLGQSALVDVKRANVHQLTKAGLRPGNIYVFPNCTIHENNLFFSNRVEGRADPAKVGRMMALIGIQGTDQAESRRVR